MLPDRYNLLNLYRTLKDPTILRKEYERFNEWHFMRNHGEGIKIINQDWDNLVILDACRYDYYNEHQCFNGDLRPVISRGAHSWEFMTENFKDRQFHDTVYVTANPHTPKLDDDIFHARRYLFLEAFDEEVGTVLPGDVVCEARTVAEEFPNKRYIIHFMQPHEPMLGPTAEEVSKRVNLETWNRHKAFDTDWTEPEGDLWYQAARKGKISHDELVAAYRENLDIVLEHVAELLDVLDGKTVITGDHGELLGERPYPFMPRRYGHPHDIYMQTLCEVPWHEITSGPRRTIVANPPVKMTEADTETVNNRLQSLGYAPE